MSKPTVKEAIDVVRNCCDLGCPTRTKCKWIDVLIHEAQEAERLKKLIHWLLGENGDFLIRKDRDGAYYWRKVLRKKV